MDYTFDSHGGFYARRADVGVIEYAYPSSPYAEEAKKKPEQVAELMTAVSEAYLTQYTALSWYRERYDRMCKAMDAVKP